MVWEGHDLLDSDGLTFVLTIALRSFPGCVMPVSELGGTFIHAYGSKGGADVSHNGVCALYPRGKKPGPPSIIDARTST